MSDQHGQNPLTDEPVDTGFGAVLAGEIYAHPEITVAVILESAGEAPDACDSPIEITSEILSSLPVVEAPPVKLTPEGIEAAKAFVQLPPHLDWPTLSRLAREVAMDLKDRHTILADFKLNQTQYDFLDANNEFYRSALAAACKDWHAPLSTAERIRVEAAAILEDSLVGIGARMQNKGEGLPGVIEAAKLFAKVAGVGERESSTLPAGERFTINIDLGADKRVSVGVDTTPDKAIGPAVQGSLPANAGGS